MSLELQLLVEKRLNARLKADLAVAEAKLAACEALAAKWVWYAKDCEERSGYQPKLFWYVAGEKLQEALR